MAHANDAAGPSSPSAPRTRKPGEVRSRSGCLTCKQRRKKCDEDFRIRQNGATSCNRCADRGIHCEQSTSATPQRPANQQRPSPYPAPGATPSSSSKLSSRAARGPSATTHAQHSDILSTTSNPAAQIGTPTGAYTAALDPSLAWSGSAHFPMQPFSQSQLQNVGAFPGLQNPAVANQLAWMSQNPAMMNRTTLRYNRPNIWPASAATSGAADSTNTAAVQNAAGSLPAQNNAVDMNAVFNMLNNTSTTGSGAAGTGQWNQAYPESMDNIMLDDFVSELMSLTGPLVGGEAASTVPQTASNTPSAGAQQTSPSETQSASRAPQEPSGAAASSAAGAQRNVETVTAANTTPRSKQAGLDDSAALPAKDLKAANGRSTLPGRTSNRYRKLLDSDAIESLLSKYSPIYERFWHATLMLLSNKKRQAAVDYLMSVVRSNKACRASVVVVCLAYHELVQRIRKGAQKSAGSGKQQQRDTAAAPPSWTTTAIDAVENGKKTEAGPQDGMSNTMMNLFPRETGDDVEDDEDDERSIRSDVAEDSNDESMPPSRGEDWADSEDEPQEEISTISRHGPGDRSFASIGSRHASDRYGSTSFSRQASTTSRSPHASNRPSLTGKLSTVKDNIQEMDDPSRDAFHGQKVEEHTVELWFDIARAELNRSREELTLDQELCAIINLRWACLCFAGAERARQLTEELGMVMQREGIDMDHAVEEEKKGSFVSVMLLTAVYTDVLDTVSDRGKRTHVTLRGDGPPAKLKRASNVAGGEAATGKTEPFFGRVSLISLEMLTCFKTISDLSADVWGPITPGTAKPSRPTEQEVAERSRQIERKVMSLPPWSDPNTSSSLRVRAFALQEIWRQTARLYLLQAVHRRGPLFPELQSILHEIIRLAKMVKVQSFTAVAPVSTTAVSRANAPPNYVGGLTSEDGFGEVRDASHPDSFVNATYGLPSPSDPDSPSASDSGDAASNGPAPFQMWLDVASWEMCTVWFLCCTVALTRADRQFCIHHLESSGLERANRDNIQVIRDYWSKQDSTGCTVDWFDFVKASGRSVVFAF
ncbi:Zn(2)-C6 fungal-type domain-containing protein [Pseudozyma hubeiensis]|nr:Zn(2)-C6 fungal-type domain-containing protein [Pseudozyma hubeiensis]